MRPLRFAAGHDGFDDIARSEVKGSTGGLGLGRRKALVRDQAHLPPLPAACSNQQRDGEMPAQLQRGGSANIGGIKPMGFGNMALRPVELGSAARSCLNRQSGMDESVVERPARCVSCRGILERSGALAWAWIWGKPNSSAVRSPFFWLHGSQASVRLLMRLVPPRVLGTICSTCSGRFPLWQ
jgi:hypothetical protein